MVQLLVYVSAVIRASALYFRRRGLKVLDDIVDIIDFFGITYDFLNSVYYSYQNAVTGCGGTSLDLWELFYEAFVNRVSDIYFETIDELDVDNHCDRVFLVLVYGNGDHIYYDSEGNYVGKKSVILDKIRESNRLKDDVEDLESKVSDLEKEVEELEDELWKYKFEDSDEPKDDPFFDDDKDKDTGLSKEQLQIELTKAKDEIEYLRDKLNDYLYDREDPYNPEEPYKGDDLARSKSLLEAIDRLSNKNDECECIDGFKLLAKAIKSNQFIGMSGDISAITSISTKGKSVSIQVPDIKVVDKKVKVKIPTFEAVDNLTKNIKVEIPKQVPPTVVVRPSVSPPDVKVNPNINVDVPRQVPPTVVVKPTVKSPDVRVDTGSIVRAINKLEVDKNHPLVKAISNILMDDKTNTSEFTKAFKDFFVQSTKKSSHNPVTSSDGTVNIKSKSPIELSAIKDKADLQKLLDDNNYDIETDTVAGVDVADTILNIATEYSLFGGSNDIDDEYEQNMKDFNKSKNKDTNK